MQIPPFPKSLSYYDLEILFISNPLNQEFALSFAQLTSVQVGIFKMKTRGTGHSSNTHF